MSRLEVPIQGDVLWGTGDVILWAELDLLLKNAAGVFLSRTFLVDTGTQITTFPAFEAKRAGLPIPVNASPIKHEQTGLEVRTVEKKIP